MDIQQPRRQLMEAGYLIVGDMIGPDQLPVLRQNAGAIVGRAPEAGRVTMTDWVDRDNAPAVEFYAGRFRRGRVCRQLGRGPITGAHK